jgi:hypothetical protein
MSYQADPGQAPDRNSQIAIEPQINSSENHVSGDEDPGAYMPHRHLVDDPEFWRSRAEEVRVIADDMKEAEAKAIMERIAKDYERLAIRAEERRSSLPRE